MAALDRSAGSEDAADHDYLQAFVRTVGSFLIAIGFLLVLVVATSQQQSLAALDAANISDSYSVARQTLHDAGSAQERIEAKEESRDRLRVQLSNLEEQKAKLGLELYSHMQEVADVARAIARYGRCPSIKDPPNPTIVPGPEVWDAVRDCAEENQVPAAASAKVSTLLQPDNNPTFIQRAMHRIDGEIGKLKRDVDARDAEVIKLRETIKNSENISKALQDLRVLDEFAPVKASRLTWVPPGLMQIILCFFAGLFGALLLTLILAVYPDNDFDFVKSESYWKRIFLGGLIAVAVFVVIGSSVSVLGSNRALIEDTNVLSYAAIGMLAGMFSERVARFLSAKGDVFAGDDGRAAGSESKNSTPKGSGRTAMATQEEIASRLFAAAEKVAQREGLEFGEGAGAFLKDKAQAAAARIETEAEGGINSVGGREMVRRAEEAFARVAEEMVTARPHVYDQARLAENVIGEETLAWALKNLCPLFPICD